jgi:hypothetical protein
MADGGDDPGDDRGLLSDELMNQPEGRAIVMLAKKKKSGGGGGASALGKGKREGPRPEGRGKQPVAPVQKLSKSQRRKLAKVEEDKRKRAARAGVVARLNAGEGWHFSSFTLLFLRSSCQTTVQSMTAGEEGEEEEEEEMVHVTNLTPGRQP